MTKLLKRIRSIEIENIRGIEKRKFIFNNLNPNIPHLFVAPNGFGKSSFAIGFKAINRNGIKLGGKDFFKRSIANKPKIVIEITYEDNESVELEATEISNSLKESLKFFVINSRLKPKATKHNMGGYTSAVASIEVEEIVLIKSIPSKFGISVTISSRRSSFGPNGKVLFDYTGIFKNPTFICELEEATSDYNLQLVKEGNLISTFIGNVNAKKGTVKEILKEIDSVTNQIKNIKPLMNIYDFLSREFINESENAVLIASCDIYDFVAKNKADFMKAAKYAKYLEQKSFIDQLFDNFSKSWKSVQPKENAGKLILKLPEANILSNGERDLLCFLGSLIEAREALNGVNNVLIIDEVFDYLDDGNLIACQYYITKFIDEYKSSGRTIVPIILTHLNPFYFKNYCFKNQHVHYLVTKHGQVDEALKSMILRRSAVNETLGKYFLHFYPGEYDAREEFEKMNIPLNFHTNTLFYEYTQDELISYISDETFDPIAVCCAVRCVLEKHLYCLLEGADHKEGFINERGTRNKLEYAESKSISAPEIFYLLGILYNDGLHLSEKFDKITPLAIKLENIAIKKLIAELYTITSK